MPTVDRVSLRDLIDSSRQLDELGVSRVIANVAEIVHKQQKGGQPLGTVTPGSIVVQADGSVTLQPGEARAAYTAPEKLRGETGDRRSDVFSLGAILWEALAHERLFEGEIENEVKASVLEGEYRSASELNANVPAELDAICKKALSRTPGDRYPSCKVMAAEIDSVLDDAGYPEDNTQIADHIATKYVVPEKKAAPVITSRDTPLPGSPIIAAPVTNDRAVNQTLQGVSPRKEIDEAIELTKKKKERDTLVGPNETRPPAEATSPPIELTQKKTQESAPLVPAPPVLPAASIVPAAATEAMRAKTPSSQPVGDTPRAKSASNVPTIVGDPIRPKSPSSQPVGGEQSHTLVGDAIRAKSPSSQPVGQTLVGDAIRAKSPSSQPVGETPRAHSPSSQPVSGLPAWATGRPTPPPDAGSTLPGVPTMLNTPPPESSKQSFSKTAVLGSMSGVDSIPPAADTTAPSTTSPSVPVGKKTEVHGSLADRLAAINSIAGLPSLPPGADKHITTAETVPTPSLATYAAAEQKAAAALEAVRTPTPPDATQVPNPPVLPQGATATPVDTKSMPPSDALQMAAASTATTETLSGVHPASVVSLPRPRSKSEGGGRAGTDGGTVRDPVAGWGWGTGPHETISGHDDDDYYETQRTTKKRLVFAIGGAAAAVLLIVGLAFAFRGSKEEKKADVSAKQTEPAVDWSQPTDPPAPPPDPNAGSAVVADPNAGSAVVDPNAGSAVVDPNAGSAVAAVDPNAGSNAGSNAPTAGSASAMAGSAVPVAEPPKPEPPKPEPPVVAKVEPPKPEPPKPEPPKPEPPKPEPPKPVKAEPPKPPKAEPKVVAKAEPKKPPKLEPPKPAKQTDPKHASWDPLAPKKPEVKKPPAPVDPYAEPKKPAVDANAAYKTGIQQFARGDSTGALATFKQSLSAHPDFAPTWRGIGMVYEKLGKRSQAKTAFKRYLTLSPSAGDAESIRERMERL